MQSLFQLQRAQNPWIAARFVVEIDDDKSVVAVELGNKSGEVVVGDVGAELAVEFGRNE